MSVNRKQATGSIKRLNIYIYILRSWTVYSFNFFPLFSMLIFLNGLSPKI